MTDSVCTRYYLVMTNHESIITTISEKANTTREETIERLRVSLDAMISTVAKVEGIPEEAARRLIMNNMEHEITQEFMTAALAFTLGFEYELTEGGRK